MLFRQGQLMGVGGGGWGVSLRGPPPNFLTVPTALFSSSWRHAGCYACAMQVPGRSAAIPKVRRAVARSEHTLQRQAAAGLHYYQVRPTNVLMMAVPAALAKPRQFYLAEQTLLTENGIPFWLVFFSLHCDSFNGGTIFYCMTCFLMLVTFLSS